MKAYETCYLFCIQIKRLHLSPATFQIKTMRVHIKVPSRCDFEIIPLTPRWRTFLDESWNTELLYASLFSVFYVESEYITFKMIHWANLKGRQF